MNNDFSLLFQFLENLGPEVSGRSTAEALTNDQTQLIGKFASGELGEEERESLLPTLLENEKALQVLVEAIRAHNDQ